MVSLFQFLVIALAQDCHMNLYLFKFALTDNSDKLYSISSNIAKICKTHFQCQKSQKSLFETLSAFNT